jgi:hypothetical protein
MKIRYGIINICLLSLFMSCSEKANDVKLIPIKSTCGYEYPLKDLEWLNTMKTVFEQNAGAPGAQIIGYNYNGNDVFLINDCYNCADEMWQVYNCSGTVICQFGGIAGMNTCPDFFETATDSTMLFNSVQIK